MARIGKPIAVTAGEQSPGAVQLGDLAAAIDSVCSNRTHKPRPLSTERTGCPFDGDIVALANYTAGSNGNHARVLLPRRGPEAPCWSIFFR